MNRPNLIVGDFVRFNHWNGSTGKIIDQDSDFFVVEWVYGKDYLGKSMHAASRFLKTKARWELNKVTEEEYNVIYNKKF